MFDLYFGICATFFPKTFRGIKVMFQCRRSLHRHNIIFLTLPSVVPTILLSGWNEFQRIVYKSIIKWDSFEIPTFRFEDFCYCCSLFQNWNQYNVYAKSWIPEVSGNFSNVPLALRFEIKTWTERRAAHCSVVPT